MANNLISSSPEEQRLAFLSLKSPRDVAKILDYSYSGLVYHIYKTPDEEKYKIFEIPKKSGGMRLIASPSRPIKIIQGRLNEVLQNVYIPKPVTYGFIRERNIVQNAKRHQKKNWVLNIDLENFFPSINFGRVRGMFMGKPFRLPAPAATILAQICCYKNELPQGAPTSPIISNMICAKLDSQLQDLAWQYKCFYTRYADDITFSTTLLEFPSEIASVSPGFDVTLGNELEKIIKENGFDINQKKTRAFPRHKRQEVTGLTVNKIPNVRRKYIMQIRAMLHDWENTDLESAQIKYATFESNQKYRNPESETPSFKQVVRGKINFLKMVKGSDNHIYKIFREKLKYLSRRDKNIPLANIPSVVERQIIIYTEGITDKLILQTAWKKLHSEEEFPYKIVTIQPYRCSNETLL
ncbi:MAG: reverse transcriptase domain-containing protein [Chloroflexota bacterium]